MVRSKKAQGILLTILVLALGTTSYVRLAPIISAQLATAQAPATQNGVPTYPGLKETIDSMRQSLTMHEIDRTDASELRANLCSLDYVTKSGTIHFDLGDINPRSIRVEPIGEVFGVRFYTSLSRAVRYTNPVYRGQDFSQDQWVFRLDSRENAESFLKALSHGVDLCVN
jgi:hypothetical protein